MGHGYDNRGFNEETLSMSGKYGTPYKKILICAKCNWQGDFENETFFSHIEAAVTPKIIS